MPKKQKAGRNYHEFFALDNAPHVHKIVGRINPQRVELSPLGKTFEKVECTVEVEDTIKAFIEHHNIQSLDDFWGNLNLQVASLTIMANLLLSAGLPEHKKDITK